MRARPAKLRIPQAVVPKQRSDTARQDLVRHGVEHVLVTTEQDFESKLGAVAAELGTTAVFDGVGGGLLTAILPSLPMDTAGSIYGFLG